MKKQSILFTLITGLLYLSLTSYHDGPAAHIGENRTGSQGTSISCSSGIGCHSSGSLGSPSVTISVDSSGIPVTHYVPNGVYNIHINASFTGALGFGFQFSAVSGTGTSEVQAGTFSSLPLHVHSTVWTGSSALNIIEHSLPDSTAGAFTKSFVWTAPSTSVGTVNLYCTVNAVDLNALPSNDNSANVVLALPVLVCPTPAITTQPTAQSACMGTAASFTVATSSTGVSYQWYFGSPAMAISGATAATYNIPSVTTVNAGNYYVVLTSACGSTTSNTVTLTVNTLPVPVINQSGFNLTTTASFSAYQWIKNGANIAGAAANNYTVTTNGVYNVRVTDSHNCQDTAATNIVITNAAVPNVNTENKAVVVYPNPAKTLLNIKADQRVNAEIKDLTGRVVLSQKQAAVMDISHLSAGLYFISITDLHNNLLAVEKLVKE